MEHHHPTSNIWASLAADAARIVQEELLAAWWTDGDPELADALARAQRALRELQLFIAMMERGLPAKPS